MSKPLVPLAGLALVAATTSACIAPTSHADDARALRDEIADQPAVKQVRLTYDEPELLDAADVDLEVEMRSGATPEDTAAVFAVAYAGLTDVHAGEEGNLTVAVGDDEVELRTFESEASTDDVEEAALAAARVAAAHRRVWIQVMTQDVSASPHVESLVLLRLPKRTSAEQVDRTRAGIGSTYDGLRVEVDIRVKAR